MGMCKTFRYRAESEFYMGVKEEGLTQAEHALEDLKEAMTKIVQ
mgnify:CR=1 FL=1